MCRHVSRIGGEPGAGPDRGEGVAGLLGIASVGGDFGAEEVGWELHDERESTVRGWGGGHLAATSSHRFANALEPEAGAPR